MICHTCGIYDLTVPKWFAWDGERWLCKCEPCLLWRVRAYADGCTDMGVGILVANGNAVRRVGSGLPVWLQNLGGPKRILKALERRSGNLFSQVVDLAWEKEHEEAMRTRRSPRNQDRLFKILFKVTNAPIERAVIRCCFNCVNYPTHGRSRGYCPVINDSISGIMEKPCFGGKQSHD